MTATILCIEDEPEIRQAIVEELEDAGYRTAEAENGQSGLATIVATQPDIVLCDINMPEMDGTEVLTNLREHHPDLADMPFVFLTAQADRTAVLNGKKLGADDYLTKPIDFELLLATVEARLGQVQRMEAKKERQFVRLYKTVAVPNAAAEGDAATGSPPTRTPAEAGPAVDPETRDKLVALTQANGGEITAGRLQFIGLDVIRTEFGDRWPAFATRIYDIAEKTIAKRIEDVDVFRRDENNNYVICFSQLSESEASFKADRIAEEIREKILGTCGAEAGMDTVGNPKRAEVPGEGSYAAKVSRALRTEVHSIPLSLEEVQKTDSVFDVVIARLDQAASVNRLAQETTLKDIFDSCKIRMSPIELRNGSETLFRLSRFDERTQLKIDGLMAGQRNTDDLAAELDMLRIGQVAEQIYARPATSKFIEIIDISISTLENRRHQERLAELPQFPGRADTQFHRVQVDRHPGLHLPIQAGRTGEYRPAALPHPDHRSRPPRAWQHRPAGIAHTDRGLPVRQAFGNASKGAGTDQGAGRPDSQGQGPLPGSRHSGGGAEDARRENRHRSALHVVTAGRSAIPPSPHNVSKMLCFAEMAEAWAWQTNSGMWRRP